MLLRSISPSFIRPLFKQNAFQLPLQHICKRCYLDCTEIGMDVFFRERYLCMEKLKSHQEELFMQMRKECIPLIGDCQMSRKFYAMIHLAEKEEHFEIIKHLTYRFGMKNPSSDDYRHGPLVMRMCHAHNKHELAYVLFMDKRLKHFFRPSRTGLIVMDLLFENGAYDRVLEVGKIYLTFMRRNIKGSNRDDTLKMWMNLSCVAAMKENSRNSLEIIMEKLKQVRLQQIDIPLDAALTTAIAALKQDKPEIALDMVKLKETSVGCDNNLMNVAIWTHAKLRNMKKVKEYFDIIYKTQEKPIDHPNYFQYALYPQTMNAVHECMGRSNDRKHAEECAAIFPLIQLSILKEEQLSLENHLSRNESQQRQTRESFKYRLAAKRRMKSSQLVKFKTYREGADSNM